MYPIIIKESNNMLKKIVSNFVLIGSFFYQIEACQKPAESTTPIMMTNVTEGENQIECIQNDVHDLLGAIDAQDELLIKEILQTVDVNYNYKYGNTPLHYAIADGQVSVLKVLVEAGADVNAQNDSGYTPLFEVFQSLFESIGMIYADGMQNAVPEDYYQEYILMAQYLMQSGADITIAYNYHEIKMVQCSNQTLSEIIASVINEFSDPMQLSYMSDDEKDCARKVISYLDKLQAVLIV